MINKFWYKIFDVKNSVLKRLNEDQMVRYAKNSLLLNKKMGLDKELKYKDLNTKINAWVYLKNIGIGIETNRKIF